MRPTVTSAPTSVRLLGRPRAAGGEPRQRPLPPRLARRQRQADGLSPATAWTSIGHLNARLADGTVRRTDTVLFESGRTFFGKLRPPTGGGDGAG